MVSCCPLFLRLLWRLGPSLVVKGTVQASTAVQSRCTQAQTAVPGTATADGYSRSALARLSSVRLHRQNHHAEPGLLNCLSSCLVAAIACFTSDVRGSCSNSVSCCCNSACNTMGASQQQTVQLNKLVSLRVALFPFASHDQPHLAQHCCKTHTSRYVRHKNTERKEQKQNISGHQPCSSWWFSFHFSWGGGVNIHPAVMHAADK